MTNSMIDKAAELFRDGHSAKEIGDLMGYSETVIAYNLKNYFGKGLIEARHDVIDLWRKDHEKVKIIMDVLQIQPIVIDSDGQRKYGIRTADGIYLITYAQYTAMMGK